MKERNFMKHISVFSKYTIVITLITMVATMFLVLASPVLVKLDEITSHFLTTTEFINLIPFDQLNEVKSILNDISTKTNYIAPTIIAISFLVIFFFFMINIIVQLISNKLVKNDLRDGGSSISRRFLMIIFNIVIIFMMLSIANNGIIHSLIGMGQIMVILIVIIVAIQISQLICVLYDTYLRFKNNEYKSNLYLISIVNAMFILTLLLFGVQFIQNIILYSFGIFIFNFVDFYSVFQLNGLYSFVIDLANSGINSVTDAISNKVNVSDVDYTLNKIFLEPVAKNFINDSIKSVGISFVNSSFLHLIYQSAIGIILSIFGIVSIKEILKDFKNTIFIYTYLITSFLIVIMLFTYQPFVFASLFGLIILIFLLIHSYQLLFEYEIFGPIKFMNDKKKEDSKKNTK